jgi:hypothetical protein
LVFVQANYAPTSKALAGWMYINANTDNIRGGKGEAITNGIALAKLADEQSGVWNDFQRTSTV